MRIRLILSFALIVVVAVVSVVLIAQQGAAGEVRMFMLRGGMTDLDGLVTSLEDYYDAQNGWDGAGQLLTDFLPGRGRGNQGMGQGMSASMANQRLRLADSQGMVVADTDDLAVGDSLTQEETQNAIALSSAGRTIGYLLAEGGMGFTHNDESLLVSRITRAALIAGLIAGGLSLLLALILASRLLRPVRDLTSAAKGMAQGDLTRRVQTRGDDEMALLGLTFNQMAESLQRSEESRKAMTADIAHELRNPLAVQRANLEALQDGIYPLSPDSLAPILEQNQMLTRLVDDLRTLAMADAGQITLERIPSEFISLIKRVIDRYRSQADTHQIHIELESQEPSRSTLSIDPLRVEQILGNLISNALRYTPDGGRIVLAVRPARAGVELTIRDSGPGIPNEALPLIFERFYRADKSRSRAEGGSGLGLAIARQLAQAHGGSLKAGNHPQGGAVFTLTLPA